MYPDLAEAYEEVAICNYAIVYYKDDLLISAKTILTQTFSIWMLSSYIELFPWRYRCKHCTKLLNYLYVAMLVNAGCMHFAMSSGRVTQRGIDYFFSKISHIDLRGVYTFWSIVLIHVLVLCYVLTGKIGVLEFW